MEGISGSPPAFPPGAAAEATARAPLPAGSLALVAIGDSLTAGDGDDCGRRGYPERMIALVQSTRAGLTLADFGRTGWMSAILAEGGALDGLLGLAQVPQVQAALAQDLAHRGDRRAGGKVQLHLALGGQALSRFRHGQEAIVIT